MPIPNRSDRQRGFSLIELLVAIVITLIVNSLSRLLIWSMAQSGRRAPKARVEAKVAA